MRNLQRISRTLLTISSSSSSSSSRHLESDICITIAVLFGIMMVLTLFYSLISQCFSNPSATGDGGDNDHQTKELRPCSELDKTVPVTTFDSSSTTPFDGDSCAVCLSELENGDRIRVLPCKHVYHAECIDRWVPSRSSRCPVCRVTVVNKCGEKPAATNCGNNAVQVINLGPIVYHNYL